MVLFISALFKLLPRENAVQYIDPRDRLVLFSCFSHVFFSFHFSLVRCVSDEMYFVLLLLLLSLLLLLLQVFYY